MRGAFAGADAEVERKFNFMLEGVGVAPHSVGEVKPGDGALQKGFEGRKVGGKKIGCVLRFGTIICYFCEVKENKRGSMERML